MTYIQSYCITLSETKRNFFALILATLDKRNNINSYFYRFENQGRHTVDLHALFSIKLLQNIALERIKATVPLDNTVLAHLARCNLSKYYISFSAIFTIFNSYIHFR